MPKGRERERKREGGRERELEAAFIKAPFINLEMNEMGIGCWGGHFQI